MQIWILLIFMCKCSLLLCDKEVVGYSQDKGVRKEVSGILEESVTLHLEIPEELKVEIIFWSFDNIVIAHAKLGEIVGSFDSRKKRLLVPDESFSLEIQRLRKEDGGPYRAQIITDPVTDPPITREYVLQVFNRIQKPNIKKHKIRDGNTTCIVTLNCTVENGGEGVNYMWTAENSREQMKGSILNVSLTPSESNVTYTCTARNPVSENSTQVTPWDVCTEGDTGPKPQTKPDLRIIAVVVVIVLFVIILVILYVRINRKRRKQKVAVTDTDTDTDKDKEKQTVYAQVTKCPTETNSILKEDVPTENGKTIYCTVDHPKQQNTETDKSVYDTVKLPSSPASATYDKVM